MPFRLATCVGALAILIGFLQGSGYKDRLANPRGSHLVVAGRGPAVERGPSPIRRVVLVVVDGLRADAALGMRSVAWLEAHGTCRRTDVGVLTRSRPVYTLLSSGVEPARSGVRTNDVHTPAPVESIWQVARRARVRVAGISALSWWQELFPDGFDAYRMHSDDTNMLTNLPDTDGLVLIHPGYVDDAGHDAGAASTRYRQAVARADRELSPFLASLDLARDVLVMTADHGHTDRGGHGGDTAELRTTLTCAAGRGIGHSPPLLDPIIDARTLPALLAVLARLPLPRHLDIAPADLDAMLAMLDPEVFASTLPAYRREAAARRVTVGAQLSSWLGQPNATWDMLAQHERRAQHLRFAGSLAAGLLVVLLLAWWRQGSWRRAMASLAWIALVVAGSFIAIGLARGRFDLAAINQGLPFVTAETATSLLVLLLMGGLHLRLWRDSRRLLVDGVLLVAAEILVAIAHVIGFGWPLGYPLPSPALLFLPYPLAAFTAVTGAALIGMASSRACRGCRPGRRSRATPLGRAPESVGRRPAATETFRDGTVSVETDPLPTGRC